MRLFGIRSPRVERKATIFRVFDNLGERIKEALTVHPTTPEAAQEKLEQALTTDAPGGVSVSGNLAK